MSKEKTLNLTRTQLIQAQKKYYQEMIDAPDGFEDDLDGSDEQAIRTIDLLLNLISR